METRVRPPSTVGTSNWPPSAAVVKETGTPQKTSAPSRWKEGVRLLLTKMERPRLSE